MITLPGWAVRVLPYVAAIAGGAIGILWVRGQGYDEGYAARDAEVTAVAAAHAQVVSRVNEQIAAVRATADAEIAALKARRPRQVQAMREAVHEDPAFAAVRRPARAHAQRLHELEEVAAAARADR